jgi:hypothetical protein
VFVVSLTVWIDVFEGQLYRLLLGHDTGPGESGKKYRPLFLDHFDKKEAENIKVSRILMFSLQ